MAALSDSSLGLANESTYGTSATPTRWYEFTDHSFDVTKNTVQGAGLRVGTRVNRSARRQLVTASAKGDFTAEITTKGFGLLFESMLGTSAVTLVSGSTYQHNFTLSQTSTTIPSRTIQTGTIQADGTVLPVTYVGATCASWEIDINNGGLATLKTTWDAKDWSTATSYTAPSYTATPNLYHFGQAAITVGGTVTAPTTTALATGGTAVTNVRSFKLSGENGLQDGRWVFGGAGRKSRQLVGDAKITGEIEVELTDTVVRDAFLNDTEIPIVVTLTTTEALSTGFAQLQFVLSAVKLNGEMPKPNNDGLVTLKASFDVLDNLTATQPIWICARTADTAI